MIAFCIGGVDFVVVVATIAVNDDDDDDDGGTTIASIGAWDIVGYEMSV